MQETGFDLVAIIMSYWFALLIFFILAKTVQNAYLEYKGEREVRGGLNKPRAMAYVEISAPQGDAFGRRFPLRRENILGSGAGCDIRLPFGSVASEHASIYQKKSKAFVAALAGRKGVYVNGERLLRPRELAENDTIRLGKAELVYKIAKDQLVDRN